MKVGFVGLGVEWLRLLRLGVLQLRLVGLGFVVRLGVEWLRFRRQRLR